MPTDMDGSPAEVQDARSTEKSAAAMARLSPFARRDPADFKTKFPLDVRPVNHWRGMGRLAELTLVPERKRDLCQIRKPQSISTAREESGLLKG